MVIRGVTVSNLPKRTGTFKMYSILVSKVKATEEMRVWQYVASVTLGVSDMSVGGEMSRGPR